MSGQVEGERRPAVGRRQPREIGVVLLAGPGTVDDDDCPGHGGRLSPGSQSA